MGVASGILQFLRQKHLVQPLAARGKAADGVASDHCLVSRLTAIFPAGRLGRFPDGLSPCRVGA